MQNSQSTHAESATSTSMSLGIKPLLNCRILLVDDSPDPRRINLRLLEEAGAQVTLECHALAGAHRAVEDPDLFDALIMDLKLPRLDGEEAVGVVRSAGYDRPILALVSMATSQEETCLLRAGFSKVLKMPRHPTVFVGEVAELITTGHREQFPSKTTVMSKTS
jgi:CheY-like chemotaxis protein